MSRIRRPSPTFEQRLEILAWYKRRRELRAEVYGAIETAKARLRAHGLAKTIGHRMGLNERVVRRVCQTALAREREARSDAPRRRTSQPRTPQRRQEVDHA